MITQLFYTSQVMAYLNDSIQIPTSIKNRAELIKYTGLPLTPFHSPEIKPTNCEPVICKLCDTPFPIDAPEAPIKSVPKPSNNR